MTAPTNTELLTITLAEGRRRLVAGDVTSVQLTQMFLDRIADTDDEVRAFVTVTAESALEQAAEADALLARGDAAAPLTGLPIGLKDVLMTRGVRTTAGSRMLDRLVPPYDATVVTRLGEAGAISLGKLNMDEFAMGSSTEHSAWFPTANPWDLERVPGGSSGGSAAAVAARQCIATLGSDTGGSIRQPASFCGVVGLKPTYGRVSRYGLIAFASSLDQIGPFTSTVEDAAMLLQAIAGPDPLDSTCYDEPVPDFSAQLDRGLDGLRVAAPQEFFGDGMDDDVASAVETALDLLAANGAIIDRSPSMPSVPMALPVYYILAPSECSANLARFDGVKYGYGARGGESMWADMEATRQHGFGREVKRRILLGAYALSAGYYDAYYLQAQKVRTLIRREFDRVFAEHDVIVAPTAPTVAFRQGEITDPYQMYLNDIYTIPANIAGLPAISVPGGFGKGRMPVGLQFVGQRLDETALLGVANAYEQLTQWPTFPSGNVGST
ncbi:MAG: Asp-tRNA(Asn)/Glu-tRNA(Gln) amidotransferase subunit GatA [Chloroflexota bacterium]|nr:Asp-tRNA(Asn)/Glu-tRNA(Gln) amidotransferase subunit GatA [Chloroflexota bacterium]MDE2893903.1 Asp-tRNA(Asn)/Glu-tRNA(Gln) amidotransferase subunit GatA [Chloroflexota bacterium]